MGDKLEAMKVELAELRAEREKLAEIAAVQDKGTAKGRSYEEEVAEAVDALALPLGDDAEAVGDLKEATRKAGDVVVAIGACHGPARGRIVFEAKNARLSKPEALRELERGMAERGADYAVLVVPDEELLPARTHPLREYNGDKLFVAYDPQDGSRIALEVAYALARARVLMARGGGEGIDAGALAETVERALGALEEVRAIKLRLAGATTSIDSARQLIDALAERVREHLHQLHALLASADDSAGA